MGHRVLIVDDEELILLSWKYTLESAGYNVTTAITGAKALAEVERCTPDIVITDLIMSEMNGIEICKKIKEKSPATKVVLISGHPDEIRNYQSDFIKAGGEDYLLRKPLSKDEIIEVVDSIAGKLE